PHPVLDPGGHLDLDRAAGADASVAGALRARIRDDLTGARAGRAAPAGHDLAEETARDALHPPAAAAGGAAPGVRAGRGAGARAGGAEDGGVDGEVLRRPEDRLV